ncbi:hypothetical protein DCS32_15550 [Dokdonia sp. Dokd-P16]|uniref:hypothetical protein n=1 Tax=Dokdonia sp. Dokd-P16 TaxID=2173169 RepID=UPI000D547784|nr:hypothetical protein [Dokdonia sp. Dokd-P16]AWH75526.1 hypothetical protein DCS32_15550 [Dokdonia sp. Dokd-P16]
MKKFIVLIVSLITFGSCNSIDDKVAEYRAIKENIDEIMQEVSDGTKDQELGIREMTELQLELLEFDQEVTDLYTREEKIKREIDVKRKEDKRAAKQAAKQFRIDSLRQEKEKKLMEAELAKQEKAYEKQLEEQNRKEVAAMIAAEEEAERNLYISELNAKGLFLVEFDNRTYEINEEEWLNWKDSENYSFKKQADELRMMVNSMGSAKANGLAQSMYRTLSKGIGREGITMKALQGIQTYDFLTTGKINFE